jgi:hypothetical protein
MQYSNARLHKDTTCRASTLVVQVTENRYNTSLENLVISTDTTNDRTSLVTKADRFQSKVTVLVDANQLGDKVLVENIRDRSTKR